MSSLTPEDAQDAKIRSLQAEVDRVAVENRELREQNAVLASRQTTYRDSSLPESISNGGFGYVRAYAQTRIAFKSTFASTSDARDHLFREFQYYAVLDELFNIIRTSTSLIFISPKPVGFWDPSSHTYISVSDLTTFQNIAPISDHLKPMWKPFTSPTMTTELIPALDPFIGQQYRTLFFAPEIQADITPIRLLRLYLGQSLSSETKELKEGIKSDLPLDIGRYKRLASSLEEVVAFPELEELAEGMGQVLAVLNWGMGVDASDIELVLAADSLTMGNGASRSTNSITHLQQRAEQFFINVNWPDQQISPSSTPDPWTTSTSKAQSRQRVQPYVLDYNKMARWSKARPLDPSSYDFNLDPSCPEFQSQLSIGHWEGYTMNTVAQKLAIRIGSLELYYPSPSIDQSLYSVFKSKYITTVDLLLDHHLSLYNAAVGISTAENFKSTEVGAVVRSVIREAVHAFFMEWEALDARRAARGRGFKAPAVSDSFRAMLRGR